MNMTEHNFSNKPNNISNQNLPVKMGQMALSRDIVRQSIPPLESQGIEDIGSQAAFNDFAERADRQKQIEQLGRKA